MMNDSKRVDRENPWNDYIIGNCDKYKTKNIFKVNFSQVAGASQDRVNKHNKLLRFSKPQKLLLCKICDKLVIDRRFLDHYALRHGSGAEMEAGEEQDYQEEPEEEEEHALVTVRRRSKKKKRPKTRQKQRDQREQRESVKKHKKAQPKTGSGGSSTKKRLHGDYVYQQEPVTKKRKLDKLFCDSSLLEIADTSSLLEDDEDDFYGHCQEATLKSVLLDSEAAGFHTDQGLYYKQEQRSEHNRVSSDSSTPPSLSLGGGSSSILHALSSPAGSSLHALHNDQAMSVPSASTSAAVASASVSDLYQEHYNLAALSPEPLGAADHRSSGTAGCCKYQIESLPWENLPPPLPLSEDGLLEPPRGEDAGEGEVARAVQSITFCSDTAPHSALTVAATLSDDGEDEPCTGTQLGGSNFLAGPTADDISVIDCFLDEMQQHHHQQQQQPATTAPQLHITSASAAPAVTVPAAACTIDNDNSSSSIFNSITSDYDEKFEALINSALCDFVINNNASSPVHSVSVAATAITVPDISSGPHSTGSIQKRSHKSHEMKCYDPLKHCGVVDLGSLVCLRGLLCKHHSMSQKRIVERSQSITALIKAKKTKRKECAPPTAPLVAREPLNSPGVPSPAPPALHCIDLRQPLAPVPLDHRPKPIVRTPMLNGESLVSCGGRSFFALKSLLWNKNISGVVENASVSLASQDRASQQPSSSNRLSIADPQSSVTEKNPHRPSPLITGFSTASSINAASSLFSRGTATATGQLCAMPRQTGLAEVPLMASATCSSSNAASVSGPVSAPAELASCLLGAASATATTNQMLVVSSATGAGMFQRDVPVNASLLSSSLFHPQPQQQHVLYPVRGGSGGQQILMLMNGLVPQQQHIQPQQQQQPHQDKEQAARPVTVHSSTPGGLLQRFVILPDGTISSAQPQQQQHHFLMPTHHIFQQQQHQQLQQDHQQQQPQQHVKSPFLLTGPAAFKPPLHIVPSSVTSAGYQQQHHSVTSDIFSADSSILTIDSQTNTPVKFEGGSGHIVVETAAGGGSTGRGGTMYKSLLPPPLVISPQLMQHQRSHPPQAAFAKLYSSHHQQQPHQGPQAVSRLTPASSAAPAVTEDTQQLPGEYLVMQSMIS